MASVGGAGLSPSFDGINSLRGLQGSAHARQLNGFAMPPGTSLLSSLGMNIGGMDGLTIPTLPSAGLTSSSEVAAQQQSGGSSTFMPPHHIPFANPTIDANSIALMSDFMRNNPLLVSAAAAASGSMTFPSKNGYMNNTANSLHGAVNDNGNNTRGESIWDDQHKALCAYRRQFGNCRVPARFRSDPKLGRWVMTQRRQFTLLMQGLPSALTAERILKLEDIGFTWSVRPEPATHWSKKLKELKGKIQDVHMIYCNLLYSAERRYC